MNCKFANTNPSAWQACLIWNTGGQRLAKFRVLPVSPTEFQSKRNRNYSAILLQILHNASTTVPSDTKYRKSRAAWKRFILRQLIDDHPALNALWFVVTKSGTGTRFSWCTTVSPITIIRPLLHTFRSTVTDTPCSSFNYWQRDWKL